MNALRWIGTQDLSVKAIKAYASDGAATGTGQSYILHYRGLMVEQYTPLKRRSTPTRLHGCTSQKALIFILVAVITGNLKYCM
jgi:hypothetical protein